MLSDLRIPQAVIRAIHVVALSAVLLADQSAPPQGAGGRGAFAPAESASIVGTVTTGTGQPIAGITVRAMNRTVAAGDPGVRYTSRSTARTDARGDYRLGLPAGDYIVDIPLRVFRPSGSRGFTATWLPPGDYLAVVYREADGAELTTAFIERLAKVATPVTLRTGERTALDLIIATIR